MELLFQKCTITHLDLLVQFSRKTFRDAFERQNDASDFEDYMERAFSVEQIQRELLNPDSEFYLVYVGETLAGYFKINHHDAQTDVKEAEGVELERIYVATAFQGQRIGQRMLQRVKKMVGAQQKKYVWLGVWEHNQKAIQFYENHGFVKFGSHPYHIGKDIQTDWLMKWEVGDQVVEGSS